MSLAVKISPAASGVFLLAGMLLGVVKYRDIMRSPAHRAPDYVDISHRAALLYSFAALVIAKLLEYSPYSERVQLAAAGVPLDFLALTVAGYAAHGLRDDTENIFAERSLTTTRFMYAVIAGGIGGTAVVVSGFVETQFL
jgi:uncharacterized membrane protein